MKRVLIIVDNDGLEYLEDYFTKEDQVLEYSIEDDFADESGLKEIRFECKDYMVDFILRYVLGLDEEDIEDYMNNGINVTSF